MSVIIKATQGAVTRRLPFQAPETLDSLRTQLSTHFTIPAEDRLTYKDEDGDEITFSTDAELVDQLRTAASNATSKVLRVAIVTNTPVIPSVEPVPQLDNLVTSISDLVTAIRGQSAQPPAKRACRRGLGGVSVEQPQPRGIFGGIRPFFAAFPPGQQLRASVKAVDHETRSSFRKAVSTIKKSKQRKQLVSGLKDATPALREFITDLPDEGLPPTGRVQVFVNAVETAIDGIDDEVDPKIVAFINKAATDPAFMDCLRHVKDVPLMPWEPGFIKRAANARDFAARKYNWEKNYEGVTVPPAPIKIGDKGHKVRFLHKVLTDLGFMNSSMYDRRPGLFAENTKKAVASFQAENNIDCEAGVYDEATANRLKQIIDERELTEATADCTMEPTDTVMQA